MGALGPDGGPYLYEPDFAPPEVDPDDDEELDPPDLEPLEPLELEPPELEPPVLNEISRLTMRVSRV